MMLFGCCLGSGGCEGREGEGGWVSLALGWGGGGGCVWVGLFSCEDLGRRF